MVPIIQLNEKNGKFFNVRLGVPPSSISPASMPWPRGSLLLPSTPSTANDRTHVARVGVPNQPSKVPWATAPVDNFVHLIVSPRFSVKCTECEMTTTKRDDEHIPQTVTQYFEWIISHVGRERTNISRCQHGSTRSFSNRCLQLPCIFCSSFQLQRLVCKDNRGGRRFLYRAIVSSLGKAKWSLGLRTWMPLTTPTQTRICTYPGSMTSVIRMMGCQTTSPPTNRSLSRMRRARSAEDDSAPTSP
ncbi:hypothetical protein HD554DRAFT_1558703 [Boletus coccyginus]|nr:hypothetical protein HD554DRAFT_1558703 [Boletus coccyginus]